MKEHNNASKIVQVYTIPPLIVVFKSVLVIHLLEFYMLIWILCFALLRPDAPAAHTGMPIIIFALIHVQREPTSTESNVYTTVQTITFLITQTKNV